MLNKVFYLLTIMLMVFFSSCSNDDEKEQYPNLKYPTTQMLDGTTWYHKSGSTTYLVSFKGNQITMVGEYGSYGTYTISDKHMIVTVNGYLSSKTYRLSCPMFLKSSSTGEYELFLTGDPDADNTPANLPKGSYYRYY